MTQDCEREKCFLKPPRIKSSRFMNVFMYFFFFFFCLQVWNVSTFRGTRWFPRRPPPLRCPSPRKPERSGPAGGQRDAGAPDKGRLRLLSTARTPRCSRDCSDLSGHTQQQKKKKKPKHIYSCSLRGRKRSSRYTYRLKTTETSSFTNHW